MIAYTRVLSEPHNSRLCPVSNLKLYLDTAGIQEDDEYIFRAVTKTKKSQYLRKSNKPLSYSRMREILLTELENIGLDKNLFGLHSLRSGGATAAANAGVPDRLFKRHGRWKSDRAKDGYVEDNLNVLLSVSKSLACSCVSCTRFPYFLLHNVID